MVLEHYEALEADWQRYYSRDLAADLWGASPLSARKVSTLVRWLPADAAFWRSQGTAWDMSTELAAVQVELLDSILSAYVRVHSKKNAGKRDPIKIPRPWERAPEGDTFQGTTIGDMLAKSGMRIITE